MTHGIDLKGPTGPRDARSPLGGTSGTGAAGIVARIAFALVFALNVQCALSFALWPDAYASQFELYGAPGIAAVQGLGIAFLMWNATYPAVIASPLRFHALTVVVLVQQAIGLVGELWIRISLPTGHELLASSIDRFIVFDAVGLAVMATSFIWLVRAERRQCCTI